MGFPHPGTGQSMRRIRYKPGNIQSIIMLSFSLLSFAQNDKGDIVKTGDKMPAFTLTSTVNGTVNSADLKGKAGQYHREQS